LYASSCSPFLSLFPFLFTPIIVSFIN
jgi:hypothetical protein